MEIEPHLVTFRYFSFTHLIYISFGAKKVDVKIEKLMFYIGVDFLATQRVLIHNLLMKHLRVKSIIKRLSKLEY